MECHLLLKLQVLFICQTACLSQAFISCPGYTKGAAVSACGPNNHSLSPDALALLEFRRLVHDPQNFLSNWDQNGSTPTCEWRGVSCDQSFRVTGLNLSGAHHLSGHLPEAALSKLDRLQNLSLRGNSFYGNLTGSFLMSDHHNCTLQYVDLSSNALNGSFSGSVLTSCSSLQVLNLSNNYLSGTLILPENQRGGCKMLRALDLSYNNIAGVIPADLGQLCSIEILDLSNNQLVGQFPSSLAALTSLISLNLSFNNLSGEIPADLANTCGSLQELDLSNNNVSGSIPVNFSTCTSIISLSISNNYFSGGFPDILSKMRSLKSLRMDHNEFNGSIPSLTHNFTSLTVLDLSSNSFSITPENICGVDSALTALYLPENLFTGPVPTSITNCTHLQFLDLSLNSFSGNIPPELFRLIDLQALMMWHNNLGGAIPSEVGRCRNLKTLLLNYNNLHGPIPLALFNCSELSWISLDNNQLRGNIPPELCDLKKLSAFEASDNLLTGVIPPRLENCSSLTWLDLHSNQLEGPIPPKIGRSTPKFVPEDLLGVGKVFFAENLDESCRGAGELLEIRVTTEIKRPTEKRIFKRCRYRFYDVAKSIVNRNISSLLFLDISYNNLVGSIPEHFGSMEDVMILELNHNSLNGSIPSSFGQLKNLEVLNLASNQLQGNIPASLSELTFLVYLNLSSNNLYGPIPQGGQLTTFPASAYGQNAGLCGVPLNRCSSNSQPLQPSPFPQPSFHSIKVRSRVIHFIRIFGIVIIALVILLCCVFLHKSFKKCSNATADSIFPMPEKEPLSINVATFERPLTRIDFTDLVEVTKGFDVKNMIGSGGFGEVYKAHLRDGSIIAVKKLSWFNHQGQRQFIAEMETLGKIKHPNLVPLLGYCKIGEERILVYEYMAGGSLEQLLYEAHVGDVKINLSWESRKKIVLDIAHGLAFLHHQCIPHVIHRDLKSSNVLLDTFFVARLSDFGMARLISASDTHNSTTSLAGTPGYVPPEYYQSCKCTKEGDVYSFGVVLLEILTRRKPTSKDEFGDNNLVGWVKLHVHENRSIQTLDPDLIEPRLQQETLQYLKLACRCLEDQPSCRPSMLQVVATLKELSLMQDGT